MASQAQSKPQLLPLIQLQDSVAFYNQETLRNTKLQQEVNTQLEAAEMEANRLVEFRESITEPSTGRGKKKKRQEEDPEKVALATTFHTKFVLPALQKVEELNARVRVLNEQSMAAREKESSFLQRVTALLNCAGKHPGTLNTLKY